MFFMLNLEFWQFCILTLVFGFTITIGILLLTDIGKDDDREKKD